MMHDKQQAALTLWKRALAHIEIEDPEALRWARSVGPHTWKEMSSEEFLRSYCFVVYASGMKYQTIDGIFADLSKSFKYFNIVKLSKMNSLKEPLRVFNLERKARNFLDGAQLIAKEGFGDFKERVSKQGMDALERLPGIGPITKKHLAKNIGLADVAKNDRWLVKASKITGWLCPEDMVDFLSEATREKRHVIDVAIWNLAKDGNL